MHLNHDKGHVLYWYNIQGPVQDIKPPLTALPTSWVVFPLNQYKLKAINIVFFGEPKVKTKGGNITTQRSITT